MVCPQCGEKLTVPFASDPKAEALNQFLKQKRAQEKRTASLTSTPESTPPTQIVQKSASSAPTSSELEKEDDAVPSTLVEDDALENLEDLEPDEVEHWIDQFWATVSENNIAEADTDSGNHVPHSAQYREQPIPQPMLPEESLDATPIMERVQQTRTLFRTLILLVFVLGFGLGIFAHSRYIALRYGQLLVAGGSQVENHDDIAARGSALGMLSYPGPDGSPQPDADAVVIFLPLKNRPPLLFASEGLRPDDETFDPNGENVIQIQEFGGMFQRTGADGTFSVPYKNSGRYLTIMISSHLKRKNEELDGATVRRLRNYFRDPGTLLGSCAFVLEEYELLQGQYQINHAFAEPEM